MVSISLYGGGTNDVGFDDLMPNYLLGLPDSFSQGSAQTEKVRSTIFSFFAQDSWKIRPNLTLNYGLALGIVYSADRCQRHVQSFRPGQTSTSILSSCPNQHRFLHESNRFRRPRLQ